ncbi:Non-motile and phage-resistance protein [Planctomycetes bacterium Pan216]|uniref:histidine kinase n=1 Tax=Kolteria novifilia TaxID=2527975 RepID=A0A518AZG0_9BACT|nr:Non-motile and phage-resistance protein [Planctomycetes bacterium Pan216]
MLYVASVHRWGLRHLSCSPELHALVGRDQEGQLEVPWADCIVEDDQDRYVQTLRSWIGKQHSDASDELTLTYRVTSPDRGPIDVLETIRLLRNTSGKPIQAFGAITIVDAPATSPNVSSKVSSCDRCGIVGELTEQLDLAMAAVDQEGRLLFFNKPYADHLSWYYNVTLTHGMNILQALSMHPEETDAERTGWERALAGERHSVLRLFGDSALEMEVFEDNFAVLRDDQRREIGATHTVQEVTKRQRAEERLRETEHRLRAAMEGSLDAILLLEFAKDTSGALVDFRILDVNRNGEELLGANRFQLLGKHLSQVSSIFSDADLRKRFLEIATLRKPADEEIQADLPHRKNAWLRLQIVPLAEGIAVTIRDITERRRVDEEIRRHDLQLRNITAEIPGVVYQYELDAKGVERFSFISDGVEELFGYTAEQAMEDIGQLYAQILPEDLVRVQRSVSEAYRKCEPWICEYRIQDLKGNIKWVRGASNPKRADEGLISWDGLFLDITAEKRFQEELAEAKEAAEAANKAKSTFLANVTHELRTPLNGILGFARLLRTRDLLTARQTSYVDQITQSGNHLLEIIDDVLNLTRFEIGRETLILTYVDLEKVLSWCVDVVAAKNNNRPHIVVRNVEFAGPILADRAKIARIFLNLLSNAFKFTPDGGTIGIDVRETGDRVQFAVWDTGVGIREEEQSRIFEPFHQIDSDLNRRFAGTGLGLSITKNLVEMHRGTIDVESVLGQGTRLIVNLPKELSKAGESPPAKPRTTHQAS